VLSELWDSHPTTPEKNIRSILGKAFYLVMMLKNPLLILSGGEKARFGTSEVIYESR